MIYKYTFNYIILRILDVMASRLWTLDVLWYVCASLLIIGVVSVLLGTVPYVKHRFIKLRNKADYEELNPGLDKLPLKRVMVLRRDQTFIINKHSAKVQLIKWELQKLTKEYVEQMKDEFAYKILAFKRGSPKLKAEYTALVLENNVIKTKISDLKSTLHTTKLDLRRNKSFKLNLDKYLKGRVELNTIHE